MNKFNLGETVLIIHNNKVYELVIQSITLKSNMIYYGDRHGIIENEKHVFRTKQELLNSL